MLEHITATWTSGDGSVTNAINGNSFFVPKGVPLKVLFAPEFSVYELEGLTVYASDGIVEDVIIPKEQIPVAKALSVEYVDADGSDKLCVDYDAVSDKTLELTNGWYVVAGKVSRGSLTVKGNVHLILMDGCELTATGGYNLAGVAVESGNSLTIYGQMAGTGKLTATGGDQGAGIGGGDQGAGGTVTINGGTVTATGGRYGAGIGGGYGSPGGTVTINGGRLKVVAGTHASVIGAGSSAASQGTVEISGGIFAWKPSDDWVVYHGAKLLDNPDASSCADYPWAAISFARVSFGRELVHVATSWTSGDGSITNAISGASFEVLKGFPFKVLFAPEFGVFELVGPTVYESNGILGDLVIPKEQIPVAKALPVEYVDADGTVMSCDDYDAVTDMTSELKSGWYVVAGKVSCGSIAVNGNVNLILMDGCELTAISGDKLAGVAVEPGNSLTIYGQKNGSGKLTATGGYFGAGIGGQNPNSWTGEGNCGSIVINGGMVTATGGHYGAGIGGGDGSPNIGMGVGPGGAGGTVTINGGTVTATGGHYGAGIGGGYFGAGGIVTINGGRLNVVAGFGASVIGPGWYWDGSPGTVAISGGIFAWKPVDDWLIDEHLMVLNNPDASTCAAYPWAVFSAACVTFERVLAHTTAVWTSGDGSVKTPISGKSFFVPKGTTGVKVIFASESPYAYVIDKTEYAFSGAVNADCVIPAKDLPTAQATACPDGYVRLDYIESTAGGGQYIDTGIKSSPTLAATMDYMAFEHTGHVNLGTVNSGDANWRYFDYEGGPIFDCVGARAGDMYGNPLALNTRYVANVGSQGDHIYLTVTDAGTREEIRSFTSAYNGTLNPANVFVFGGWSSGSIVCTPMRLYSLTLRDFKNAGDAERTILAEFVPCYRKSDGAIGLYDLVGERFVENAGSGTFVAETRTVTVPRHDHVTAFWTSGDGALTNVISETSFDVVKGMTGIKVFFTPEDRYELDKTEYAFAEAINEDCTIPAEDLPTATYLYAVVTVGQHEHMTAAAWTSGDGTVTNAISGTTFEVLKGTTGVKVIFTPEDRYSLDKTEYVFAEAINADFVIPAEDLPTATLTGPICEGGEIIEGEGGVWVVTPSAGVTEVTVMGLPEGATVAVPLTVKQVSGVADAQIKVRSGAYDITGAFAVTGGAIALNPNGVVAIGGEEIPVKPTIGDLDEGEPFTVGKGAVMVTVRAIPGLWYALVRGETVEGCRRDGGSTEEGGGTVVESVVATGARVALTDANPPKGAAFYRVEVSVP